MRSQVPAWNRTVFHQGIRHLNCFFLGLGPEWPAGRAPRVRYTEEISPSIRNPTCFPIINVFVQIGIKNSNSPMLQGNVEMLTFVSKILSWEHLLTKLNWHRKLGSQKFALTIDGFLPRVKWLAWVWRLRAATAPKPVRSSSWQFSSRKPVKSSIATPTLKDKNHSRT